MTYRRVVAPSELPQGEALTGAMIGIGMNFSGAEAKEPNIEDVLLAASVDGMERDDLRVLSVLVTWLGVHTFVNADRLVRAVQTLHAPRVLCFWAAMGHWLRRDRRLARLANVYDGPRQDLLRSGSRFHIRRKGEDKRFIDGPLCVPNGVLRDRPADVLSASELAGRHRTYRFRVLMGPSYRADMWAELEQEPMLSAYELARRTYGSFATAWQVKRDRALLGAPGGKAISWRSVSAE